MITSFPNLIVGINIEKKQDPVAQTVFVSFAHLIQSMFLLERKLQCMIFPADKKPRGEAQALVESWKRFQSTEAAKSGKQWQTVYCDLYAG